jgi:hypothetical protein
MGRKKRFTGGVDHPSGIVPFPVTGGERNDTVAAKSPTDYPAQVALDYRDYSHRFLGAFTSVVWSSCLWPAAVYGEELAAALSTMPDLISASA